MLKNAWNKERPKRASRFPLAGRF